MLIIQIALGIVLAVLVLAFLPQLLSISIWLAVAIVVIGVVIGVFSLASNSISEYIPDSSTVNDTLLAIFGIMLILGLIAIVTEFISKLINQIKSKNVDLLNSNKDNSSSKITLILSVFWDNFNTTGKIALIGIFLLALYGLLGGDMDPFFNPNKNSN